MEVVNAMSAARITDIATCSFVKRGKSQTEMSRTTSVLSTCSGACTLCGKRSANQFNHHLGVSETDHIPSYHCEGDEKSKEEKHKTKFLQQFSAGRYFNVLTLYSPSTIFKIVVLFMALNVSSIEAFPAKSGKFSPVLRSIVGKLNSSPIVTNRGNDLEVLQRFARNAPNFHRESYRRVHIRTQHETRSCEDFVANLSHMHQFAYSEASKIFKRPHRKREATNRLNLNRSWGEVCAHAHRQYTEMSCYINARPVVYGRHTSEVKAALKSMANLVQQEMNRINYAYHNDRTCSTNKYLRMPDYTAARQVLFNMFTLNSLIKQGCSNETPAT